MRLLLTLATCAGALVVCGGGAAAARQATRERPRGGDFGSSLGRLRWDQAKQAAVETPGGRGGGAAGDAEEEEVVRVETSLAVCDVLVVDPRGRPVRGLTREDFLVTHEGRAQPIATFALGDDRARERSIVLVIDYSGSQLPYLKTSIDAAKTLVDQLQPADRMAIVTDDVTLLADFTGDKKALKGALDTLTGKIAAGEPPGRSRQYSALLAAVRELLAGKERPVVIFQTDGDELSALRPRQAGPLAGPAGRFREFGLVDVITAAEKARATVYAVIPGSRLFGLPPDVQLGRVRAMLSGLARGRPGASMPVEVFNKFAEEFLRQQMALEGLSKLTGGWAEYLESPADAGQVYARILSDINHRYVIGFQPTDRARDGRRRRVEIVIPKRPEYRVLGRKSFYPPGPEE